MKAICVSVNFDLFMVLPHPTARIAHAAKLEFSSKDRSEKKQVSVPLKVSAIIDPFDGGLNLSKLGVGSRSPAAWSSREIELQALASLAALAQISTPSAAHFLKSHQLLVQKFAADRNRQRSSLSIPFDNTAARKVMRARCRGLSKYPGGRTVARSIDARRRCSGDR
jgi:hypothetical protein